MDKLLDYLKREVPHTDIVCFNNDDPVFNFAWDKAIFFKYSTKGTEGVTKFIHVHLVEN